MSKAKLDHGIKHPRMQCIEESSAGDDHGEINPKYLSLMERKRLFAVIVFTSGCFASRAL